MPLMNDERGVAGASFISRESARYPDLMSDKFQAVALRTEIFHSLVLSKFSYMREFVKPLFSTLSDTQLQYVVGLASGKKTGEIAAELGTSAGYLEQTMLKLRRKLSGVQEFERPTVTRNQILYYAGLLNFP